MIDTLNIIESVVMQNTTTEPQVFVSLTDWATETERDDVPSPLVVLNISPTEPAYVSLFTDEGPAVTTHYLEGTDTSFGGYVHCLGQDCPACAAQTYRKRFVLLPVADLTDARIKILRVPSDKGPGKLLTEIVKVLGLPNRAEIITKINRKAYQYIVEAHRQDALSPDVAAAIKRFAEQLSANVVDLRSVVAHMAASEMRQHERIARRLELEGPGPCRDSKE